MSGTYDFTIKAWVDANGNGIPDSDEQQATVNVHVIELGQLTDSVPDQQMNDVDVSSGLYSLAYNDASSGGNLQSVEVSPTDDPDSPFQWQSDYGGGVDASSGSVSLSFDRPGPYLLRTIRDDANGNMTTSFVELLDQTASSTVAANSPQQGKTIALAKPSATLILIDSASGPLDNGFLSNAKTGVQGKPISSVQDAINDINAEYAANGDQPFTLAIIAHGGPGIVSMGAGTLEGLDAAPGVYLHQYIGDDSASEFDDPSEADRVAFEAACAHAVSQVTFYACDVFVTDEDGDGESFTQELANSGNMTVYAFDCDVTASSNGTWSIPADGSLEKITPNP